jgi:hypothetical protein
MIRKIAVLTTVAALATTGVATADAPTDGSLTGAGTVTDPGAPFAPVRIGVNARLSDGVPQGRVVMRTADFSFVADVQCYVQDGDTVRVAGEIVQSKELSGGFYALAVQDSAEGDRISLNASADVPLDCNQSGEPVFALEDGNMTVHGTAPVPADTPSAATPVAE